MNTKTSGLDLQQVRANKMDLVERLADDLAHEIKNPLHSMVINLEVLRRRISRAGGSEPDELLRYAGVLGSELDRVNRRIELLLRLVRPDPGAEPVTLRDALEELSEVLRIEGERRGIAVRVETVPVPVRPHLAPDLARQLVLNLALAALDAQGPGGELVLRTEVAERSCGLSAEPGAGAPLPPASDPRISVARRLAEDLGGGLLEDGAFLRLSLPTRDA